MIIKMLFDFAGFEAGDVIQVDGGLLEMILEEGAGVETEPTAPEPKPAPVPELRVVREPPPPQPVKPTKRK